MHIVIVNKDFLTWLWSSIAGEGVRLLLHKSVSTSSLIAAYMSLVQPDRLQQHSVSKLYFTPLNVKKCDHCLFVLHKQNIGIRKLKPIRIFIYTLP